MSDNLTQSASGIQSMVMTCHNAAELAKWMVKQLEWKKWKESDLKKKSLSELQNMCMTIPETQEQEAEKNSTTGASSTMEMSQDLLGAPEVDATAQTTSASKEQVTLPTAMATDEELWKLLKEHKQIQAGNKYKISKNAFKELLIACQRGVEFLSKVRKVATCLMDRDFIHLKNKVATGEWACFHLNFSYHINGASAQLNESETNIITNVQWLCFYRG
ncbi:uncharacterized protein ACA1_199770 [Acanthamoeba castellanii str. Neff]|uniref:Uncharacterized protein n=1 Tax=Acanthamoeba castellanii (strain ATCC 30010 / Neff) TaxID=1257118 RepID=L8H4N7_ACACF|nr:uncharacterized protein ACA1_199770 [Acanthamoeba castellanii str. Neff]ELR19693.1 hypothetical protein ACA1_199770 [Acanthamoeba castellanii str. Neff]